MFQKYKIALLSFFIYCVGRYSIDPAGIFFHNNWRCLRWKTIKSTNFKTHHKSTLPKYYDIMTILFSKPNLFLILPIVALRSGNLSFKKQYKTIWYYNEIYWVSPMSLCIVYNYWARAHGWWHDSGLLIFTAPQIVFFCLFSKKKGRIYTKCNICSLKTIY